MENDIQQILDDCDDYEVRVVREVAKAAVDALRSNEHLKRI